LVPGGGRVVIPEDYSRGGAIDLNVEAVKAAATVVHYRDAVTRKTVVFSLVQRHEAQIQVTRNIQAKAEDPVVIDGEPSELTDKLDIIVRQAADCRLSLRNLCLLGAGSELARGVLLDERFLLAETA